MAKFLYSMVHHKPNNKLAVVGISIGIGIFALIAIFLLLIFWQTLNETPKDMVLNKYLKALNKKDAKTLESLVAPEYDATEAIKEDINKFGGINMPRKIYYSPSKTNGLQSIAHVIGFKGIIPVRFDVTIQGFDTAWYVVEGKLKPEYNQ